jgi:hypothetical protein
MAGAGNRRPDDESGRWRLAKSTVMTRYPPVIQPARPGGESPEVVSTELPITRNNLTVRLRRARFWGRRTKLEGFCPDAGASKCDNARRKWVRRKKKART